MLYLEHLDRKLNHYSLGIHSGSEKIASKQVLEKVKKQVECIKNAHSDLQSGSSKKLIDLCKCCVAYLDGLQKAHTLRNILKNAIDISDETSPTLTFHAMLEKVITIYDKHPKTISESRKVSEIKKLIANIQSSRDQSAPITKLSEKCKVIESSKSAKTLANILKAVRIATLNKVQKNSMYFESISQRQDIQPIIPSKIIPVAVFIWNPHNYGLQIGSVGHVAIKTPTTYASFWPARGESQKYSIKKGVSSQRHSYFEDLREEGRPPDHKFVLYSLDAAAIDEAYKVLANLEWKAGACDSTHCNKFTARNCSSMSATLLVLGGLRNLFPENESDKIFSIIQSADTIRNQVHALKKTIDTKKREMPPACTVKDSNVFDVSGALGAIGVNLWNSLVGNEVILPNNFLDPIKKASLLEEIKFEEEIIAFKKGRIEEKRLIEQKIQDIGKRSIRDLLRNFKNKLIYINWALNSLEGRRTYKKTYPKLYEQQAHYQTTFDFVHHSYKKLYRTASNSALSDEEILEIATPLLNGIEELSEIYNAIDHTLIIQKN
ncbi:hypothetical protein [Parachlamydia acanthamoebae]|uniref:hypothetical protein n=1 Tax=Parachlamydia acanthamoebae TaxID=83552 RepID=UPI0001C17CEE|nr:hypothetical protein [Parachlamydia acanthamoebae]EFB41521.1 hypothetical protein pah_c029o021 [Parachlamydia acanthamoebae str. Hall's coccus]